MKRPPSRAWCVAVAGLLAATATGARDAPPPQATSPAVPTAVTLVGKVVPLSGIVKALGPSFDTEPIERQVVLVGEDGTVTPLLCDDASRALFRDERLRGRPTRIEGRMHAGLPYLQVLSFQIEVEGRWRTPEYYCEICTISVRFPQICPCCQGAMELRNRPER